MRVVALVLPSCLLALLLTQFSASAHDLPDKATVRIQSSEFFPGWHVGTVQITKEGCALVWKPAQEVSGGRRGVGLLFIQKLERQDGTKWIEMPVGPMMKNEPKLCQEGAG